MPFSIYFDCLYLLAGIGGWFDLDLARFGVGPSCPPVTATTVRPIVFGGSHPMRSFCGLLFLFASEGRLKACCTTEMVPPAT
jgi:hypothetical protein